MELDTSAAKAAAAGLNDLIIEGVSPYAVTNYAEAESLQVFKAGDAALMRNWPYAWAELQKDDSTVKGNVGISLMVARTWTLHLPSACTCTGRGSGGCTWVQVDAACTWTCAWTCTWT